MYDFDGTVLIEDAFLRDGLQNEPRLLTLAQKRQMLAFLEKAGLRRIQLGAFVRPDRVPQMGDAEALFAGLTPAPGVTYTALVLNGAGLDRALAAGLRHLSISASASEAHSRRNAGCGVADGLARILPVIERAQAAGITVRAGIQSAFGCGIAGRVDEAQVAEMARRFGDLGVAEINLADTAGLATPRQVHALCLHLRALLPRHTALSLHLHDTRGMGIANMVAGLQAGVRIFDAALGGLGGCPFLPGATGNIATEDAVFACEEMGLRTGVDWQALGPAVAEAERLLGRTLPGRMSHVPPPPTDPRRGAADA